MINDQMLSGIVYLRLLAQAAREQQKALDGLLSACNDEDCLVDSSPAFVAALAAAKKVADDWRDTLDSPECETSASRLESYRMLVLEHIDVVQQSVAGLVKPVLVPVDHFVGLGDQA